jgi:hypothetical protein
MKKFGRYILVDGKPVPELDLIRWAEWFGKTSNRAVASTQVGKSNIDTCFLGIDHNFHVNGPPILWETLVFGGPLQGTMDRCAGSREQAEAMHASMVERVKQAKKICP